jgi:hypothetical protein
VHAIYEYARGRKRLYNIRENSYMTDWQTTKKSKAPGYHTMIGGKG